MTRLVSAPRLLPLAVTVIALIVPARAHAASPPNQPVPDAAGMALLEERAAVAAPREQCFLYTELLHQLTELASQQMTLGEDNNANATFQHIDAVADQVQKASARDTKRLKNAEQLLERVSLRVADMAKVASGEQRSLVQATLKHVERVHSSLLALVFSH